MKNRKIFAFDLDGTLIANNEIINKENKEMIDNIIQLGHIPIIITGRDYDSSLEIYHNLGFKHLIANNNGAMLSFPGNNSFKTKFNIMNYKFTNKLIEEIIKKTYTKQMKIIYYYKINASYSKKHVLFSENTKSYTKNHKKILSIKIKFENNEKEIYENTYKYLKKKYCNDIYITNWVANSGNGYRIELLHKNSRKDIILEHIAKYYKIPLKNTIAFGDGYNDIEMLNNAGWGVAMSNSLMEVKNIANDVTEFTCNEGGVKIYINKKII